MSSASRRRRARQDGVGGAPGGESSMVLEAFVVRLSSRGRVRKFNILSQIATVGTPPLSAVVSFFIA